MNFKFGIQTKVKLRKSTFLKSKSISYQSFRKYLKLKSDLKHQNIMQSFERRNLLMDVLSTVKVVV